MTNDVVVFQKQLDLGVLETVILDSDLPQVSIPVKHTFGGGVYVREMRAPADTIIIGKRHRYASCNILIAGEISIYMGPDLPVKKLSAPCTFVSPPGTKKMGYTHTDVVFANIHPTESEDLDEIEREFIITEVEWKEKEGMRCLG